MPCWRGVLPCLHAVLYQELGLGVKHIQSVSQQDRCLPCTYLTPQVHWSRAWYSSDLGIDGLVNLWHVDRAIRRKGA
jgi:hypothetical protein